MAKGRYSCVKIDRVAFKAFLEEYLKTHHTNRTRFATELGFCSNFFTEALRDVKPKNISVANYKYLCSVLKVPEDRFILKEEPNGGAAEKKEVVPTVVNAGLTAEQFNALIQTISNVGESIAKAIEKIGQAQNSETVISGKIYGEVQALADALGVHQQKTSTSTPAVDHKPVTIKPQYSGNFGGKK